MKTIRSIAVIGATGMLGKPVTKTLKKEGYSVTAVVRDIIRAQTTVGSEFHFMKGDVHSVESLRTAFRDVDYVYISLSTQANEKNADFKTELDGIKNIITAAKKANIKRIGYLSSLVKDYTGFDWWLFDIKREACKLLLESGIPATIFYPSNFFENLSELQHKGSRVMLAGNQVTKSWWISAEDYGKQVAEAFRHDHNENREYPVQGLEPMNMEEAADVYIKNYPNGSLKKMKAPMWVFKLIKPLSAEVDFQFHIISAINHYDESFKADNTWAELGKPELTLKEWTRRINEKK